MPETAFRNATVADIDGLVDFVTAAYRGDSSRQGWTTEADVLDGNRIDAQVLRDDIQRDRSRVLLLERGDELLSCAHICEDSGAGYFGMFAVKPTEQGRGIGKQVMDQAERVVRDDWQLPVMRMTVIDVRAELIAFYERRGYHRTGQFKPFPYGDERFGRPRRDGLRFEVLEKALCPPTANGGPRD